MAHLYPFLMLPGFVPRPWGTHDLSPIYTNHKFTEKIGDAWLRGDDCIVANGRLMGKTLAKLSEQHQREPVVYAGDMIYVAGGTGQTLGPGSVIVETQQQSDTTYRLYDYGRPRELHLKNGMAAVKEKVRSGKVVRPAPEQMRGGKNRHAPLVG